MANRAIIYAIYPNKRQKEQCQKTFGCCRFVYNQMLTIQQGRYKNGEKHLSRFQANNYCNQHLKTGYPFLKEVDKFAITNAIYHLEDSYHSFFSHLGKFPKYKSKHKAKRSYTTNFTNQNIEVGDQYVKLPKLGKVKARIHRLPGKDWKIKSATITQNRDDTYQVSVLFAYDVKEVTLDIKGSTTIGLDYRSNGLYTDSNGDICGMPHYYRRSAERLAKAQRRLRHMVIGSNNYRKQQKRIAKIHRQIANQRKDYLHKRSTAIIKQYDCVCVEDLNMRAMANKGFGNGKATMDNGYGMFLNMLDYKLKERGGRLVKVDKWYPSSQICNCCGMLHTEMRDLSIRIIKCSCGHVMDRDQNAAMNIKKEGLRSLIA